MEIIHFEVNPILRFGNVGVRQKWLKLDTEKGAMTCDDGRKPCSERYSIDGISACGAAGRCRRPKTRFTDTYIGIDGHDHSIIKLWLGLNDTLVQEPRCGM